MRKWAEQDVTILRLKYPIQGSRIPELREKFTADVIRRKASELGIARAVWTEEEDTIIRQMYPQKGTNIPELRKTRGPKAIAARALKLGVRKYALWTDEEDAILREKYVTQGKDIPELLVNHSYDSIENRVRTLKIQSPTFWTCEEDDLLREQYPLMGAEISKLLERHTTAAIRARASYLGVSKIRQLASGDRPFNTGWTAEEDELLVKLYPTQGADIPELLTRYSIGAIRQRARRIGVSMITPNTVTRRNSSIKSAATGYIGTDNKVYFYVQCSTCDRVLLLSAELASSFSHGTVCEEYSVPMEFITRKAKTILFYNKQQK